MEKNIKNNSHSTSPCSRNLLPLVEKILTKKNDYLRLTDRYKTPFYTYNQEELDSSISQLLKAFRSNVPRFQVYYAMKLNHHPLIVERVVKKGLGLDVASKKELSLAIKAGAKKIVYFSPGKSDDDLLYAVEYADIVRIHIDSFGELHRLGRITNKIKKKIEVGVRVNTPSLGLWTKYGIPLKTLNKFWKEAGNYPFIQLNGVHFHQSRNRDAGFYINMIRELAMYLDKYFSSKELKDILYVDLGGGFEPYCSEGVFIPNQSGKKEYNILISPTIEEYANTIGNAIKKYLDPVIKAIYLLEPGRYICNSAMSVVLSVADIKDKENCILDGGVNMVGWQRFEHEYFPLINLSSPSKKEITYNMWGNLCTTWDIWGYYCYTNKIREGDVIVIPNQGALTYSLAQNFIQTIPPVYKI